MSRPAVLAAGLLCALPGGWLASLAWSLTTPVRLALVVTGALVGAAVAALAATDPAPPPESRAAEPSPPDPFPSPDGGERAERAALIAQCPRCGELRLDSGRDGPAFRFRCGNPGCGHAWTWHPDEPWPLVVVRRNLPSRADRKPG